MLLRSSRIPKASSCNLESFESIVWPEDSPRFHILPRKPGPQPEASITLGGEFAVSDDSSDTACFAPSASCTPMSTLTGIQQAYEADAACHSDTGEQALRLAASSKSRSCLVALRQSVEAFVRGASSSTLLMSALTFLDISGGHPAVWEDDSSPTTPMAQDLRWTISSMLALFLRSGRAAASECDLLALLWMLESWVDAHRSSATSVLGDYIRYLAAFDPSRAGAMTAEWETAFTRLRVEVVAAQLSLLRNVGWSLRLTAPAVTQCYHLLFGEVTPHAAVFPVIFSYTKEGSSSLSVAAAAAQAEAEAHAAAAATTVGNGCVYRMNVFCGSVWSRAARLKLQPQGHNNPVRSDVATVPAFVKPVNANADACSNRLVKRKRMA